MRIHHLAAALFAALLATGCTTSKQAPPGNAGIPKTADAAPNDSTGTDTTPMRMIVKRDSTHTKAR